MHIRIALLALALAACPAPPQTVGKYVKAGGNFLEVTAVKDDQLDVSLSGSYGMNTCQIETGPQKIENCEIAYTEKDGDEECNVRISFASRSVRVEQRGECGCGLNVNLSGVYRKQSKTSSKESR
jgi:hypothetical protein